MSTPTPTPNLTPESDLTNSRIPRTATPTGTRGSLTQTQTTQPDRSNPVVLRLRGSHTPRTSQTRRIQWDTNVIDNEGLGRKKSKVCCIYHKPRPAGESSDESSSDSDSGSGSDADSDTGDTARPAGRRENGDRDQCGHRHRHRHPHASKKRNPSPNAYEKMPRYDVKPLAKQPGSAG